jgi:hypothetical protein
MYPGGLFSHCYSFTEVRMRHAVGVLIVLLSTLSLPDFIAAQVGGATVGPQEIPESGFRLGSNYPNPFTTETRIPFELFEVLFAEGRPVVVTIRIFDILLQHVGSPTALNHPAGDGTPVLDLEYVAPGRFEALWDGRDSSGIPVAWGSYIVELTVNGRSESRRVFISGG